ncbi:transcriptional regulator [Hydrogenophaga crassostreae]|uniref:Transcriptional regulator n=1 Tax=Hydrogenophaga crassostreae TaxID=1763535 RepID=A0A163CA09_9BURK|nr:LysR family transcriptional regulator [Hydrogenophaga crassostreae]AOW12564.1 LysR family transcriptional regulator [Hydrogenophaga crassostreae]OAD40434.1 transcriptional regulator [Hydrogenophaga crassostreae]
MSLTQRLEVFARVAELSSFTQAAEQLGLPRATVSNAIQQLENQLGTRLLHRTTRRVQLTQDGLLCFERCKDVLSDLDELQSLFQHPDGGSLKGRVRIDMSSGMARNTVMPRLPDLLAQHPHLTLEVSSTDRLVDLVREGFDCVLRAGQLTDSGLVARPLGHMSMVNCASPAYLKHHGTPQALTDLAQHKLVHYSPTLGAPPTGFEYADAEANAALPMTGAITVNSSEAYTAACLAGLGLIQAPLVGVVELIDQGRLVPVLPSWRPRAMPVTLLYAHRRNLPKRVRVVMDWLARVMAEQLAVTNKKPPASGGFPESD